MVVIEVLAETEEGLEDWLNLIDEASDILELSNEGVHNLGNIDDDEWSCLFIGTIGLKGVRVICLIGVLALYVWLWAESLPISIC